MAWEEPRKTGMQYRRLGNSGLHVSVLGLGGWLTYVFICSIFLNIFDMYNNRNKHVINQHFIDSEATSKMVKNPQHSCTSPSLLNILPEI